GRMNAESGKLAGATEPLAEKQKTGAYLIDRFESGTIKGGHADVNVTYDQAAAACADAGKRLCTADEWERACKGPENFVYGYGDVFDAKKCGPDVEKDADRDGKLDAASGGLEGCTNKFGVADMAGGAREWTSTADKS